MESKKDKLSSLPDDILANVLSRLQIDSAVATSVLSHRWRYLWTGVTTFNVLYECELASNKFSTVVVDIVRQLTSQTLHVFKLHLSSLSTLSKPSVTDACFREVCSRNAEQIIIKEKNGYDNGNFDFNAPCLFIPAFLFSSKNLEALILTGTIKLDLPENTDIQLPNLKKISLKNIVGVPHQFLGSLFRSCQRLIDAKLIFEEEYITEPEPQIVLNISAPNLRLLRIELFLIYQQPKILIDAPKLETLNLASLTSDYYSIQNPSKLVKASIDVPLGSEMLKFIWQLSSLRELSLRLADKENTNLYHYLNSANLGTFPSLERLETRVEYGGWKDLLLSMRCFPNLRHVSVYLTNMGYSNPVMVPRNWCVPECLSKLKTIEIITGQRAVNDELRLLKYILSNALVLEKLEIRRIILDVNLCDDKKDHLWNAFAFCKSLIQLPRASSTCEIVFSIDGLVRVSSKDCKNGNLICEISSLFDIP